MESVSVAKLWATRFLEFVNAGEAGINSLMASAKLVQLSAGQQVFYPGVRSVSNIYWCWKAA